MELSNYDAIPLFPTNVFICEIVMIYASNLM